MAKNVLLIEYEQRDRNRVRSLLESPEYDVTEAHDGEEGLEKFSPGRFDLVLLCGKLPRMSSADVIREIRNKGGAAAPPIVLLMAGYNGSNTKADAQRIGAFEIVPKPFPDGALIAAVRSALGATDQVKTAKSVPASRLTSTDIFSDLLDELGRDAGAPAPRQAAPRTAAPAPKPVPKPAPPADDDEMERRLRDTLSGVKLKTRPGAAPAAPTTAAPPAAKPAAPPSPPKSATAAPASDIDRMLTETLRIKVPKKPSTGTAPGVAAPASAEAAPPPRRRDSVSGEGPDRFGQYELLERIASGGMAELFRARRTGVEGFQKIVAIKKILPHIAGNDEFITMFADEAKLAAQLNHPNIVHIYDLGKIPAGGYFIAMEYVEGLDLRTILRSGRDADRPLPIPLAVYVASKVASALDYAHRRRDARGEELNIVHRDVSPQNILISHEGEIKLCDFGIAKADRKVSKTETGSLKGKLQYMSPEQAWGKSIDLRSDLFSLGCVLHEMLTGERLFRGDSDMTVLELVRKAEVVPPSKVNPEVPTALDAIVVKALARDPGDRYGTGAEMLRDLETVLYSYTPAPGSADLAIYLNRLREAQAPVPTATPSPAAVAREAAPPAAVSAPPAVAAGSKTPPPAAPAPASKTTSGVFGSFSPARMELEKSKRLPIYIGIAAIVLIGAILAVVLGRKAPAPAAPEAAAPPALTPVAVASNLPVVDLAPTSPPLDPKGIEQEVQRQLAAKRDELQRIPPAGRPTPPARRPTAAPAALPTQAAIVRAEPTAPPPPTEPPPEPTAVVVAVREEPPPPREAAPAPPEPEVMRGDLVGPGPGVVEPALIAPPRIQYPPIARQQKVAGRVVILVLVNENGTVSDARVQKGIGGRTGIDGIVLDAVRGARFRAATKNGIPVRMWRTVVVDVRP